MVFFLLLVAAAVVALGRLSSHGGFSVCGGLFAANRGRHSPP